ncbi:MAG: S41 family peptidase [Ferruginibacter sp.]
MSVFIRLRKFFFIVVTLVVLMISIAGCEKALQLKNPTTTADAMFDDLWHTLDKNYALFSIKGINWDSVYVANKLNFNGSLNSSELFTALIKPLEALKDGHVTLISPGNIYTYENFHTAFLGNFNLNNVKKNYLKNIYKEVGPVIYKVDGDIGYLYYASFEQDISDLEIENIFAEFSSTKGLIIDVRNNPGGKSSNVEKLFCRFINAKKLVRYELKKKGPGHNEFYDKEPVYLLPVGNFYSKPMVVLTNRSCFSACNDFVMYMSYLPNVTIAGDQTGGGGSIPADYLLANGWKLQYSSTITLSPDNLPIENGIQPDVVEQITPVQETNGQDPILEKAIKILQ